MRSGGTASREALRTPFLAARRWLFFGLVGATTLVGTAMMLDIVRAAGVTLLEIGILALFVPTFGWISLAFWSASTGFALQLLRRDPISLAPAQTRVAPDGPIVSRTALVMPAHNEDPDRLMAGIVALVRSLDATGQADHFDIHLLSDTTDPDLARSEEALWRELLERVPRPGRLHYRRRASNVGRKAGNIADFCEMSGSDYDFMVVLDADSVMSGETLVELVLEMQANPQAGLIQTVPIPARQETLFGRFVQFAGALYGPMLASGQAFWQAESANYWGHNAILRMRPFIDHGRLPVLPGTPPLGGRILSHDFVEAALLRRAGWLVYLMPSLGGSYEEVPTNVLDYAKRDRRWAQGSLQHLRLLRDPGWNALSRLHFALGAMGYLASVLWLLILLGSTAYVLLPALSTDPLVTERGVRFGGWSMHGVSSLLPLLQLTVVVLFLPKVLGLILALLRRRAEFGGALALLGSVTLEVLFSVLIAPLMMMYHTSFVLAIVAGRDVEWDPQARVGRDIAWPEAWRRTVGVTALGTAWAGLTIYASPMFFAWLSPIFAGLVLAAPIVRWSSSARLGRVLRRRDILVVPSEIQPPPELRLPSLEGSGEGGRVRGADDSKAKRTTERMHEAERGLFDLRRGRLLLVTPPPSSEDVAVLCSAVESLTFDGLEELERLGSGGLRLVVTLRRAKTMGIDVAFGGSEPTAVSLRPRSETPTELFRLSSAVDGFDATGLDARPATEPEAAALALARFGRLLPAMVTVPAAPELTAELLEALESGATLRVDVAQIQEMTNAAADVGLTFVGEAHVPLEEAENTRFMLFREANGQFEHVAVLIGEREDWPDPVPVRLHSACLTGDLFGSLKCDCGDQLRGSLRYFASCGGGVLLYLQQEGRGIGLANKLRAYNLQQGGLDTVDADRALGFGGDERSYAAAVGMLNHLAVERVLILTNNPEKVRALEEGGIRVVGREPLHGTLNRHNLPYVRAKVQRAGHWFDEMLHGTLPGA